MLLDAAEEALSQGREDSQRAKPNTSAKPVAAPPATPAVPVAAAPAAPVVVAVPVSESLSSSDSDRLKTAGNAAMAKGDFSRAISSYSLAIKADATNVSCYNNRAQAYLKARNFELALTDATFVLAKEPNNSKALYRRALARKEIGGTVNITAAIADLTALLLVEPGNKVAVAEKLLLQKLLSEQPSHAPVTATATAAPVSKDKPKPLTPSGITPASVASVLKSADGKKHGGSASSVSVGVGDDQMKVRSVTTKKRDPLSAPAADNNKLSINEAPPPAAAVVVTAATVVTPQKKTVTTATTPSTSSSSPSPGGKEPVIPSDPPKTLYELERVWRGLKNRPDLFANYLRVFKKSTYKRVFKDALSSDLLSSLLLAVRHHLDPSAAFLVLSGLASTDRFEMTKCLLPMEDIHCIRECLDSLEASAEVDNVAVVELKRMYGVH